MKISRLWTNRNSRCRIVSKSIFPLFSFPVNGKLWNSNVRRMTRCITDVARSQALRNPYRLSKARIKDANKSPVPVNRAGTFGNWIVKGGDGGVEEAVSRGRWLPTSTSDSGSSLPSFVDEWGNSALVMTTFSTPRSCKALMALIQSSNERIERPVNSLQYIIKYLSTTAWNKTQHKADFASSFYDNKINYTNIDVLCFKLIWCNNVSQWKKNVTIEGRNGGWNVNLAIIAHNRIQHYMLHQNTG